MIDVAILSIIPRWHLRDQIPLREIARRLGISRNTVRRYLRADVTVIPPLLTRGGSRDYAAAKSRCFGVMPPMPMFGRS